DRNDSNAIPAIFDGLHWLGLNPDEPPVMQSSRAARHVQVAHELVARGAAYRSYETAEELNAARADGDLALVELKSVYDQMAMLPAADAELGLAINRSLPKELRARRDHIERLSNISRELKSLFLRQQALHERIDSRKRFRSIYRDGAPPPRPDAPYVVRL